MAEYAEGPELRSLVFKPWLRYNFAGPDKMILWGENHVCYCKLLRGKVWGKQKKTQPRMPRDITEFDNLKSVQLMNQRAKCPFWIFLFSDVSHHINAIQTCFERNISNHYLQGTTGNW